MRVLYFSFLFFFYGSALDFNELKSKLNYSHLKGHFIQEKKIQGFPNTIRSMGSFSIAEGNLLWETKKPIQSAIKITQNGIYVLDKHGEWKLKNNQYDKHFFLSVIQLNFSELQKNFNIQFSGDANEWKIKLTPIGTILQKIFASILISGNRYVQKIVLLESNGDHTTIIFQDIEPK